MKHHHNKGETQSPHYQDRRSLSPLPGPSPHSHSHHPTHQQNPQYTTTTSSTAPLPDETIFFDRVKRYIDDHSTYKEFLKLLNLFVQEIIDARTLIEKAASFLGEGELMAMFKGVMRWDERIMGEGGGSGGGTGGGEGGQPRGVQGVVSALERPKVDLNTCQKYGPSYRKLPKNVSVFSCLL